MSQHKEYGFQALIPLDVISKATYIVDFLQQFGQHVIMDKQGRDLLYNNIVLKKGEEGIVP